ncbi:hypothetical protein GF338_12395 [candidate division WOR-3 bacterium]|nr:hypothetical protein [candidate division WOR-3 bacterium]
MKLIYTTSLGKTIDALNHAFFFGEKITPTQMHEAAAWITSRHGKEGAYADMFAPTTSDFNSGARLFTGEGINSKAATAHILGEEACRALHILGVKSNKAAKALDEATAGIQKRLDDYAYQKGTYCCGTCTPAMWRHAVVGNIRNPEKLLTQGLKTLKQRRLENGRWRAFPLYYTLLALLDIELPQASDEMRHAAPVLERMLLRLPKKDKIYRRRRTLAERVLAKI